MNTDKESNREQELFWRCQLSGELPILELPLDRPRPPVQSFIHSDCMMTLNERLYASIRDFCSKKNFDLFVTLLSAYMILLCRHTNQEDIIVGTLSLNGHEAEGGTGKNPFVNPIAFRSTIVGDAAVSEVLENVSKTVANALNHNGYPFSKIVEITGQTEDSGRSPVFQTMLMCLDLPVCVSETPLTNFDLAEVGEYVTGCDLVFYVFEAEDTLGIRCEYDTALFTSAFIEGLLDKYRTLLKNIPEVPDCHVFELPILTDSERYRLLETWNATQSDYPESKYVHQLFEAQVEKTPDAVAVVYENEQLSYAELNHRANRLAHYLIGLGVLPDTRVAIGVERSMEMVVGMLAVLKAGGAYVPLDPAYPAHRLAFMLRDSAPKALLTQSWLKDRWGDLPDGVIVIGLDCDAGLWCRSSFNNPNREHLGLTLNHLAYVIYTSGSTGTPKGVMVEHGGLSNLIQWYAGDFDWSADDTVLIATSCSFDLTQKNIFAPLAVGARVQLALPIFDPAHIVHLMRTAGTTITNMTPSMFHAIVEAAATGGLGDLKRIVLGGEPLQIEDLKRIALPRPEFVNAYGPTECTAVASCHRLSGDLGIYNNGSIPLGRPIANTRIYILDDHRRPVPVGVAGELYIGGAGVARGYLNRPELTAECFLPDPFASSGRSDARIYKTGDLGRWFSDGTIEFLGRNDFQVKVRGFRIELGEIESVLKQHPVVYQAIVVLKEDARNEKRLIAYLVTKQSGDTDNTTSITDRKLLHKKLMQYLKTYLPEHMIPSGFVFLDTLPLLPNGKVDRQALPEPGLSCPELEMACLAPRTRLEKTICAIWQDILNLKKIGIHDNFFDLGGHSLLAFRAHNKLCIALEIGDVPITILFQYPTVSRLAGFFSQETNKTPRREQINERVQKRKMAVSRQKYLKGKTHGTNQ